MNQKSQGAKMMLRVITMLKPPMMTALASGHPVRDVRMYLLATSIQRPCIPTAHVSLGHALAVRIQRLAISIRRSVRMMAHANRMTNAECAVGQVQTKDTHATVLASTQTVTAHATLTRPVALMQKLVIMHPSRKKKMALAHTPPRVLIVLGLAWMRISTVSVIAKKF